MDNLAKKLNITEYEEWYKTTYRTIRKHGGGGLLASKYKNSLSHLLTTVYPEYPSNHNDDDIP